MKSAVILVNLGTPAQPTPRAVRRFLREFLSDRRVVELPRLLWLPLLYGVILPFRSRRVAGAYRQLWRDGDSPLRMFSQSLAEGVQQGLTDEFSDRAPVVRLAMTYGEPNIQAVCAELAEAFDELLVIPLFPQYSATTTAPVLERAMRQLSTRRNIPQWQWIKDYHRHPLYIRALANSVKRHWEAHGRGERLLMSFHGIPKRNVALGDPYEEQCRETAQLLARELLLSDEQWFVSFQSRLGRAEWLQPYTDVTLKTWGNQGVGDIDVICPAFATECLETLEEIDTEGRHLFAENGGGLLRYIPCLNDSEDHRELICALIEDRLKLVDSSRLQ